MSIEDDNVVNDDLYCLVIESFRAGDVGARESSFLNALSKALNSQGKGGWRGGAMKKKVLEFFNLKIEPQKLTIPNDLSSFHSPPLPPPLSSSSSSTLTRRHLMQEWIRAIYLLFLFLPQKSFLSLVIFPLRISRHISTNDGNFCLWFLFLYRWVIFCGIEFCYTKLFLPWSFFTFFISFNHLFTFPFSIAKVFLVLS